MAYLQWLAAEIVVLARANRGWMGWNLLLAAVPAGLAAILFRRSAHHGLIWWIGLGMFALFLPNAPYVITDLIHLRGTVASAPSDGVVLAGVLPMYAAFVGLGLLLYTVSVRAVVAETERMSPRVRPLIVVTGLHAVSAFGVVIGRMARLNSWDTVTAPLSTFERSLTTLTWRGAPVAVGLMFVVISVGYAITSRLIHTATNAAAQLVGRLRSRLDPVV